MTDEKPIPEENKSESQPTGALIHETYHELKFKVSYYENRVQLEFVERPVEADIAGYFIAHESVTKILDASKRYKEKGYKGGIVLTSDVRMRLTSVQHHLLDLAKNVSGEILRHFKLSQQKEKEVKNESADS